MGRTALLNSTYVKILLILPFDSIRKRMSIIVETSKGPLMYTKGADSAILERLDQENSPHKETIKNMVKKYSCQGLRTLCFAMKYLTDEEFKKFKHSYEFTQTAEEREGLLSEQADSIETDLTLLGVTGIEDRLQDGVCETVTSLREAGIQIWVLTGDKLETAENIARSSGLFEENLPIYTINCIEDFNQVKNIEEEKKFNLILSADVVKTLKEDPQVVDVLKRTKCVLCHRMIPSQKAEVVTYVRKELKARTLAIGDGANDVPMIQKAHVGIGVKGKEGTMPIVVGVLDQDYEAQELLQKPHLYRSGREGTSYTYLLFFLNILDALWQAAVVYFFTQWTLLGNTDGLWYFGFYLATGMMFVNSFHLMLEVRYWTIIIMVIFSFFFLIHFGLFLLYCLVFPQGMVKDFPVHVFFAASSNSEFWLFLFAMTVVALLPRFLLRVLHNSGITSIVLKK